MKKIEIDIACYDARKFKSSIWMTIWIFAWTGTMVLTDKAVLYEWYSSDLVSLIAIIINAVLGLGMIIAFLRLLKVLDELQRKIQLDALALSVGVTAVGGYTYSLLETTGFIMNAKASDIMLLLAISYASSVFYGLVRYR